MKKVFIIPAISLVIFSAVLFAIDLNAANKPGTQAVIAGNNAFGIDLYKKLSTEEGNLFFSPESISMALAMTYAGARGNTEAEMAKALHFTLNQKELHPAFFELAMDLEAEPQKDGYQLITANALWGQSGYKFEYDFIETTKRYYDAGFKEVDFIKDGNRENTRKEINSWVEKKTNSKIKDLIKPTDLTYLTRLVLTNAIYFKGKWQFPFDAKNTKDGDFVLLNGEKIKAPMMHQKKNFNYAENDVFQALEMPYAGDKLSMAVLLPRKNDGLKELEASLTSENLTNWLSKLSSEEVRVSIPKFKMSSGFELSEALKSLGMIDAFGKNADFSGITSDPAGLVISKVIHKAYVDVYEEGTEAAAATAVVMAKQLVMEKQNIFNADHPFIFIVRDATSGNILFMGRVEDPRK
ncbi:MAG: serpin family protein [Candidatus Omnitrophica bacterium]|nr:serpin family protein [Candidatus Omnitrophota bacterium]